MLSITTNKRLLIPVILAFTFISLYFVYKLSNRPYDAVPAQFAQKKSYIIEDTATVEQLQLTKAEWESCLDPGQTPSEYLSIVIVTRVDNYAG
jgi:hypothetical protein